MQALGLGALEIGTKDVFIIVGADKLNGINWMCRGTASKSFRDLLKYRDPFSPQCRSYANR
jgi:hypothetical protein